MSAPALWGGGFDPVAPEKAIEHFKGLVPVTDAEFSDLDEDAQDLAFRVAGAANLELVSDVWFALTDALEVGTDFDDFKDEVSEMLAESWGGEDPFRVETIFRTNLQMAYSYGRYSDQVANKESRPVWQFQAVMDSRTSDICEDLDGTTLDADDSFWNDHQPPLHFNCRSTIVALTEQEAPDLDDKAPDTDADEGFGGAPNLDWEPDLSRYPDELAALASRST